MDNNIVDETSDLLDQIDILSDNIAKMKIKNSSEDILDRIHRDYPKFYNVELQYQKLRNEYSSAYFSGSEMYVGDSITDWYISKPFDDKDKCDIMLYAVMGGVLRHHDIISEKSRK
jgi:hypothetical protein